jgi:hypothetical protein
MGNPIYDYDYYYDLISNEEIIQQHLKKDALFLCKKEINTVPLYCIFMNRTAIEYILWVQDKNGDCFIPITSCSVSGYITRFGKHYCDSIKNGYSLEEYYNKYD